MAVKIIIDSACDFAKEQIEELGLEMLPIKTLFDDEEFLDGITMTHEQFFERLIESNSMPKTSQVTPFEYEQAFEKVKEAGDTAVCITLSSKLSGCYQSANIALDGYEDCVKVVDSMNVCIGEQILVRRAIELRDNGATADEIVEVLEKEKNDIKIIALLDTLEYLKKGGRISSAAAIAGAVLSIKPVISVVDGEIVVLGKARGSKNGNNMIKQLIQDEGSIDFSRPYSLGYSGLSDKMLQKYIKDSAELYEGHENELPISTIGCAIGTHVGPGAIVVAFFV